MKKIILLLLLAVAAGLSASAQAYFANYTTDKLVVASENGSEAIVNPRSKALVNFLPSNGIAKFTLYRFYGFDRVKIGEIQRRVIKKTVTLRDFNPEAEAEVISSDKKAKIGNVNVANPDVAKPDAIVINNGEWWSEAVVVPKNETDYRLTVLTAPFKGLALKPDQASKKSKSLRTGICEFVVYFDTEVDSVSSGRAYNWAVFNKIIAEDQDTLRITKYDLKQTTIGKQIFAPIVNKSGADLFITAGPNSGKVIPSKGMEKLDLFVGWNVLSVQYIKNGLPVQAVLLFMVSDRKKSFFLDKGSSTAVDFSNMTILSR